MRKALRDWRTVQGPNFALPILNHAQALLVKLEAAAALRRAGICNIGFGLVNAAC